ncbi:MAG: PAS domain S-box protein, partial [Chitinophagaceae bacterium]
MGTDSRVDNQTDKDRHYPSYQHLKRVFDQSLDVICIVDRLGRFLEVSNAAAQIWGFCPEELLGRPFMELVCDEDRIRT